MKITDTYEWLLLLQEYIKVGITSKAQKEIGEIVHIHFPKIGDLFEKGQPILVLESTKSAIDTYAPISGEIIEVNTSLLKNFHHLNEDPEGMGWLLKIKPHKIEEYHALENLRK